MKIKVCFAFLLAFLAVSCAHTNKWYVDAAVRSAREFVLESDSPRLTTGQQEFIRFASPVVLVAPVLDGIPYGVSQVCITWVIPDYPYAVMVCGYGDDNFSNWTPNRILLRDLTIPNPALDTAIAAARSQIMADLYDAMTPAQYNRVRFSQPEIYKTAFDLPEHIPGISDSAAFEGKTQYSAVWKFDREQDGVQRCAVACGTAGDSIEGWNVIFCACMDLAELEAARVGSNNVPLNIDADVKEL